MVEEFSQWRRRAGATGLLPVNVVHGGVGPETEGEGVVEPGRVLTVESGLEDDEESDIGYDAKETEKGYKVGCHPEGKEFDAVVPLEGGSAFVLSSHPTLSTSAIIITRTTSIDEGSGEQHT